MNKIISWFQTCFPNIVNDMKNTTHHYDIFNLNPYHLEGDVWSHTMLVCNEARKISKSNNVYLAALLHDVGKPSVCEKMEEKMKVSFQQHENVSTYLAIEVLEQLKKDMPDFDFDKTKVLLLINWHSDFHTLGKTENGSFVLSNKEMDWLIKKYGNDTVFFNEMIDMNEADNNGRFLSTDKDFGYSDKFKVLRNLKLEKKENEKRKENEVIILSGLPACGKSTLIKQLQKEKNYVIISSDNKIKERYPELSYNQAFEEVSKNDEFPEIEKELVLDLNKAIKGNKNIIIDRTNLTKKSRRQWIHNFERKNYIVKNITFFIGEKLLNERNILRNKIENKNIPSYVYYNMIKNFTIPGLDECENITYCHFKDLEHSNTKEITLKVEKSKNEIGINL